MGIGAIFIILTLLVIIILVISVVGVYLKCKKQKKTMLLPQQESGGRGTHNELVGLSSNTQNLPVVASAKRITYGTSEK